MFIFYYRYFFHPRTIPVGSKWIQVDDVDNPFEPCEYFEVVDVKNGHVKVKMYYNNTLIASDIVKKLNLFYALYREKNDLST
jgi:hypothetical protein